MEPVIPRTAAAKFGHVANPEKTFAKHELFNVPKIRPHLIRI
jgi:hypothetical protein